MIDRPRNDGAPAINDLVPAPVPVPTAGTIEMDIAGGHPLRIIVVYDTKATARLIGGLSA
jgi:hypothetical protein